MIITPESTREEILEAFAALGDTASEVRFTEGVYGAMQGIYRLYVPEAKASSWNTITLDAGAVIDFGASDWASMFVPGQGTTYRSLWCESGTRIKGPGTIRNGGGRLVRGSGTLLMESVTLRAPACLGVFGLGGDQTYIDCTFSAIGIDPEPDDPVWAIVGRVPVDTMLEYDGLVYDIHAAVARVGLSHLIQYAEDPDIVDNSAWEVERLTMYYLVKHLGTSGDGLKAIYSESPDLCLVERCLFEDVSGQAVHVKAGRCELLDNEARGCHSLYHASHSALMDVAGNRTVIRNRNNGPRRATGFAPSEAATNHDGNVWEYHQGPGVTAYRGRLIDLSQDRVFSDDGEPVPVDEGEPIPAEPIPHPPPDRVLVPLRADQLVHDLEVLDLYKTDAVTALCEGVFSERMAFDHFTDLILDGPHFVGVESLRTDGEAALMLNRSTVRVINPKFEDCSGAGLYAGLCDVRVVGMRAKRLGWNAANVYKCTGGIFDTRITTTNQGADPGWDTGAVKITRCTSFAFRDYDSHNNVGPDLWIDHANTGTSVVNADVSRVIIEKSIGTRFEDCVIGDVTVSPDAVQLRAAPDTTFQGCEIFTAGKEKIVVAGNTPEVVDGVEMLTENTVFQSCTVRGQRLTADDPYNFRFTEGTISRDEAKQRFLDTVDDAGLTWEPIDVEPPPIEPPPVDPPDPPDTGCACEDKLDAIMQELDALRATVERIEAKQDRPLIPHTP